MSRAISNLVWKSAALSAGVGILLSSGGAIAAMSNTPEAGYVNNPQPLQLLAQSQRGGDVIIDDTGTGGSNSPIQNDQNRQTNNGTRFSCDYTNGQYTVMYHPESRPSESYPWATPRALGDGWTPQRRCEAISQRLETYRPDGLVEMRTAVQNRYNVVCVTTQQVPGCRIVLTVPQGQNAEVVRDQIFQNLTVADSGQSTIGVNTFTGNGNSLGNLLGTTRRNRNINLRPFLDQNDGGTGTKLRTGVRTAPAGSNYRFKPGSLR